LIGLRVLKCGVGGYGPRHELHKLQTIIAKAGRPRLVIVGYTMSNDLLDDYLYPGRTVIDGYMVNKVVLADMKSGVRKVRSEKELQAGLENALEPKAVSSLDNVKNLLIEHSILYNLIRDSGALRSAVSRVGLAEPPPTAGWEAYRSVTTFPWLEEAWKQHLENLRQLKLAVEEVGATMLVVMIPEADHVYEFLRPPDSSIQWEYPYERLSEFFQRERIAYADLRPEFRRYARHNGIPMLDAEKDMYWPRDGHPNVKGNRLAGLLISRFVLEGAFLEIQDKDKRLSDVRQHLAASGDVTR
jgi:hypothetical protein